MKKTLIVSLLTIGMLLVPATTYPMMAMLRGVASKAAPRIVTAARAVQARATSSVSTKPNENTAASKLLAEAKTIEMELQRARQEYENAQSFYDKVIGASIVLPWPFLFPITGPAISTALNTASFLTTHNSLAHNVLSALGIVSVLMLYPNASYLVAKQCNKIACALQYPREVRINNLIAQAKAIQQKAGTLDEQMAALKSKQA